MPPSTAPVSSDTCFAPVPRGEKRRREIAVIAEQVFFEGGFSETTMQQIAARAGASKETLYRHFGSKEGLFAELVEARARAFLENLNEKFEQPGSVEHVLHDLGIKMLEAMVRPDAIALCRLVITEVTRNPEIGRVFYEAGPNRVRQRLTEFLAAARERGEFACPDVALAARIFIGALVSSYHLEHLVLHDDPGLSSARMETHVQEAVAMVMARYTPR